jgi:hypothetical protein
MRMYHELYSIEYEVLEEPREVPFNPLGKKKNDFDFFFFPLYFVIFLLLMSKENECL